MHTKIRTDDRKLDADGELLREGETYHVAFEDCCVAGKFTSRLVKIGNVVEDDWIGTKLLVFDNGVSMSEMRAAKFVRAQ